jgi:hypothetical protein
MRSNLFINITPPDDCTVKMSDKGHMQYHVSEFILTYKSATILNQLHKFFNHAHSLPRANSYPGALVIEKALWF